jgi:NAD(P)-dependent dehydrogenase (short-subunit alcohol dehydrogenase family)
VGAATIPDKVKLFAAITFAPEARIAEVTSALARSFGSVDFSYGPVPFDFTDYYGDEMGRGLRKMYLTFETPAEREALSGVKVFTNDLECRYAAKGRRAVNIDPGYIAADKLVLASTKDFYHRVYLSQGIFAEVTLHYRKGIYRFFSWTFPDYREPAFLEFLQRVRARYVKTAREARESRRG